MPKKGKRRKELNNKGFTLIEVLAVIVILVIIMAIAIPNISASLERQTCKTINNKIELLKSAAEIYVSNNKNTVKVDAGKTDGCKIELSKLDIDENAIKIDDLTLSGGISVKYDAASGYTYKYCNDPSANSQCNFGTNDYDGSCPNVTCNNH